VDARYAAPVYPADSATVAMADLSTADSASGDSARVGLVRADSALDDSLQAGYSAVPDYSAPEYSRRAAHWEAADQRADYRADSAPDFPADRVGRR
jgi:hypothetical protein